MPSACAVRIRITLRASTQLAAHTLFYTRRDRDVADSQAIEADIEPLRSTDREIEADLAQPFMPESQM